jgi:deoxyribodipyrimidine photo-lyase
VQLPTPHPDTATDWVREHLGDLCRDEPVASGAFRGGQTAADAAVAALDLTGYAKRRNEVLPVSRRGATALSPWIRHGLVDLPTAWDAAADAPPRDRAAFRDELCWQEYARHLYARLGTRTRSALRAAPARAEQGWDEPWPAEMACVDACLTEAGW